MPPQPLSYPKSLSAFGRRLFSRPPIHLVIEGSELEDAVGQVQVFHCINKTPEAELSVHVVLNQVVHTYILSNLVGAERLELSSPSLRARFSAAELRARL